MFRKRYLPVLMAVLGLVLAPRFAGAIGKPLPSKPAYGGTLVWGTQFKPTIINPIFTTYSISSDLLNLVFDGLIRINHTGKAEPDLAERWDISSDGLIYTFHLREGVRFHDGVEMSAGDVQFSYEQYRSPDNHSPFQSKFNKLDRMEVTDKRTIRFYLKEAEPTFLNELRFAVIPRHILEGHNLRENSFNYAPVGTGPFRFVEWDRDTDEMLLEYNPDYFEGRPYLDRVVVKTYRDAHSLWAALMRHEVDLVQFISEADYQVLNKDPAFKAYAVSAEIYSLIVYDLKDAVLADLAVRQAIAQSVDVDSLLDRLSDIQGIKSVGPFHPDSPVFNHQVKPFEYDPEKALQILNQNGWRDSNGNGVLDKNGQDLEIRMLVDERDLIHKKVALILRQQMAAVGIRLKVQLYKNFGEVDEEYVSLYKPQAWLRYYQGYVTQENSAVNPWHSGFTMPGRFWKYNNKELDHLIEQVRTESNPEKKNMLYKTIHRLIYEEQSACFLFFHEGFFALSAQFGGTENYFNINMPMYTIKDWYLIE